MAVATRPRSSLQCGSLLLGLLALLGLTALVNKSHQLPDQEPDDTSFLQLRQPSQLSQKADSKVVHMRGNIQIKRSALTEGPRLRPGKENFDSIEAYFPGGTKSRLEQYVIGWKPVVQQHKCPDGTPIEFVHHMNVLSVDQSSPTKLQEKVKSGKTFSEWDDDAKLHFVASYDRGAGEYRLPHGYGIPFKQLVLEYHLLMPECWDFSSQPFETSGIDLYVTAEKPAHLAGIFGMTDESMDIKLGAGVVDHVTLLKPESLAKVFTKGALGKPAGNSHLQLLAVHLHTHEISKSKSFEVLNRDGSVMFRSKEETTGYGPQQSFLSPKTKGWTLSEIEPGQSLRVHCKFDKGKLHQRVIDGVSHGEEMCSALLVLGGPSSVFKPPLSTDSMLSMDEGFFNSLGRLLRSSFASIMLDIHRLVR